MSGWRKRQIKDLQMNKDQGQELYTIKWKQAYDTTSLVELMDELLLQNSEFKEAKAVIERIKAKL